VLHHDKQHNSQHRARAIGMPFLTRWRRPPPTVRVYSPRPVAAPRSCQPGTREVARCCCSHRGGFRVPPLFSSRVAEEQPEFRDVFSFLRKGFVVAHSLIVVLCLSSRRPRRSCVRARAGGGPCCSVRARRRRRRRNAPGEALVGQDALLPLSYARERLMPSRFAGEGCPPGTTRHHHGAPTAACNPLPPPPRETYELT
jgi:hypothetical protein